MSRMPRDESIAWPPSHCPHCRKAIRWRDNIPVLSYIVLRGKCHFCHKRISRQYPVVELLMAMLFLFSAWHFRGHPFQILMFDVFSFYLLTIAVIDYHHKIIPDELSLSLLMFGLLSSFWNPYLGSILPRWAESVISALLGGGVMLFFAWFGEKIFKKEALGGGDVKLMAAFGSTLGWNGLLGSLTLGSFVGALWGGSLLLLKRKKLGESLPYGPFLCFGALISLLFPNWWTFFLSP